MKGKHILIFKLTEVSDMLFLKKISPEFEKEKYFPRKADYSELPALHTPIILHKCQYLKDSEMNQPGVVLENTEGPQLSIQAGQDATGARGPSRLGHTRCLFCNMANDGLQTQKMMPLESFVTRLLH